MREQTFVVGVMIVLAVSAGAYALPFYDDFNSDVPGGTLTGWTYDAAGTTVAGSGGNNFAQLGGGDYDYLYQAVPLSLATAGPYAFSFDFNNSLSSNVPENVLPDLFAATLYLTDSGSFDATNPGGSPNNALALMDQNGATTTLYAGSTATSGPGLAAGWSRYTLDFMNPSQWAYVVPTFEFINLDGIPGNSPVEIDNVNVSLVPEPISMAMLGCLGVGMLVAKRMSRRVKA